MGNQLPNRDPAFLPSVSQETPAPVHHMELGPDRVGNPALEFSRPSAGRGASRGPSSCSASCALCARHRNARFAIVGCASGGIRDEVVEFDEARLGAPAHAADKRALPAIALPDGPSHRGRNVPCDFRRCGRRTGGSRPVGCRVLRPGELLEQQRERLLEDGRRVAVWNREPQEVLRVTQLVVRLTIHRELNLVAGGRERLHARSFRMLAGASGRGRSALRAPRCLLALVTRRGKDLHVILRCQDRSQQANRREVRPRPPRAARESPGTCLPARAASMR